MASAAGYYLLGLVGGYLTITVCESFFHRTIQHASAVLRGWYLRLGGVGRVVLAPCHPSLLDIQA